MEKAYWDSCFSAAAWSFLASPAVWGGIVRISFEK